MNVSGRSNYGIDIEANLTINGGTVTATPLGTSSVGIYAKRNIIINGGTVTATGRDRGILGNANVEINGGLVTATGSDYGILANGNVEINSGLVETTSGYFGVMTYTGDIIIDGGSVNVPVDKMNKQPKNGNGDDVFERQLDLTNIADANTDVKYMVDNSGDWTATNTGSDKKLHLFLTAGAHMVDVVIGDKIYTYTIKSETDIEIPTAPSGIYADLAKGEVFVDPSGSVEYNGKRENGTFNKIYVYQSDSDTKTTTNTIASYIPIELILDGVNINASSEYAINLRGDTTLTLLADNKVITTGKYAVYAYSNLTINGAGSLTANGGNYGIYAGGNVTITGVDVTATGNSGKGISAEHGNVEISDGKVTATGGSYGIYAEAGDASTGNITINSGTVEATATSNDGHGIRARFGVTINGDSVKATSIEPQPKNSNGENVYLLTLTVPEVADKDVTYTVAGYTVKESDGNGNETQKPVSDIKTKTDDKNKLYLYLPKSKDDGWQQVTVKEGDKEYYKYLQITGSPTSATCVKEEDIVTPTITAFSIPNQLSSEINDHAITVDVLSGYDFTNVEPTITTDAVRTAIKDNGSLADKSLTYTIYNDKAESADYNVTINEYTKGATLTLGTDVKPTYGMNLDEMLGGATITVSHSLATQERTAPANITYDYSNGVFVNKANSTDTLAIKLGTTTLDGNSKLDADTHNLTVGDYPISLTVKKKSVTINSITLADPDKKPLEITEEKYNQSKTVAGVAATVQDGNTTINYTFTAVFPDNARFDEEIDLNVENIAITDETQSKNYTLTFQSGVKATGKVTSKAKEEVKITFNPNGGTVTPTEMTAVDNKLQSLPTPQKSGYKFEGWFTSADGGEEVTTNTEFDKATTVYAHWKKKSSGGSSSSATPKPTVTPTPTGTPAPTESVAPTVAPTESVAPTTQPSENKPYISGYEENGVKLFKPDSVLTRAEVATILANISDDFDNTKSYDVTAPDVSSDAWYRNYIGFAVEKGYLVGYEDGTVRAENNITRAELAVLLARFGGIEQVDGENVFPDMDSALWSVGYVNAMAQNGYITGYEDGTFRPQNNVTRAEVVAIVNRLTDRTTTTTTSCPFVDVNTSHWAYNDIVIASC